MSFETEFLIIHRIELRPDDVVEITYSEKDKIFEWGAKLVTWPFDREAVPSVEIQALLDSVVDLLDRVELKARGEV